MGIQEVLCLIDDEISRLEKVRNLLTANSVAAELGAPSAPVVKKRRKKKRNLTPEGRKRIAEAVKRRWAAQKKAAAK